jgi:hypothetical protein
MGGCRGRKSELMSQRSSGYERKERDAYQTPAWVTEALIPHLPWREDISIWEPAAGSGQMVAVLKRHFPVVASDIESGVNFLATSPTSANAIITNPPYALAREFIEHALWLTEPSQGMVAMLLRTDFDHANGRQHLFSRCAVFAKKLVLTRRIVWFEGPKAAPSFNHAWYVWNWQHVGVPTLAYGCGPEISHGQNLISRPD